MISKGIFQEVDWFHASRSVPFPVFILICPGALTSGAIFDIDSGSDLVIYRMFIVGPDIAGVFMYFVIYAAAQAGCAL